VKRLVATPTSASIAKSSGNTVLKYMSGVLHVIKMVDYGCYYALFTGLHSGLQSFKQPALQKYITQTSENIERNIKTSIRKD
jgi:hypothetical protein